MAKAKSKELEIDAPEVAVITPEVLEEINQEVTTALSKEQITMAVINDLVITNKSLSEKEIKNKEDYTLADEVRKNFKTVRCLIENICKAARDIHNAKSKKILEKEREYTKPLSEIEYALEVKTKSFKVEMDKQEADRKAKLAQRYVTRLNELRDFGAVLSESSLVLDDVSYEIALIQEAGDELWGEIKAAYKTKFDAKEEFAKEQCIKDEAKRKEIDDFNSQRRSFRIDILKSIGMEVVDDVMLQGFGMQFTDTRFDMMLLSSAEEWEADLTKIKSRIGQFREQQEEERVRQAKAEEDAQRVHNRLGKIASAYYNGIYVNPSWDMNARLFTKDELIKLSDEDFEKRKDAHNREVEQRKEQQVKDIADGAVGRERRNSLAVMGANAKDYTDIELGRISQHQWNILYANTKEALDKKKAEELRIQKEQEMDLSSDTEKWKKVMEYIKATPLPEMRSAKYRAKISSLRELIEGI